MTIFPDERIKTLGQLVNKVALRKLRGTLHFIIACTFTPNANVFKNACVEQHNILKHNRYVAIQTFSRRVFNVHPANGNATRIEVVQARYQVQHCCFAATRLTHQRAYAALRHRKANVFEHRFVGIVRKIQVLDAHIEGRKAYIAPAERLCVADFVDAFHCRIDVENFHEKHHVRVNHFFDFHGSKHVAYQVQYRNFSRLHKENAAHNRKCKREVAKNSRAHYQKRRIAFGFPMHALRIFKSRV
ncbi:Uncharacterised protein [Chlamydia trachomatis]|nr:Uncharacterised protein [Chlamydia trachomatis]